MNRRAHPPAAARLPLGRIAPAAPCLRGVGLTLALVPIGGVAALAAWVSPLLAFLAACYLALVVVIVVGMSREDRALRRFRRQLAALPETVHPRGY